MHHGSNARTMCVHFLEGAQALDVCTNPNVSAESNGVLVRPRLSCRFERSPALPPVVGAKTNSPDVLARPAFPVHQATRGESPAIVLIARYCSARQLVYG